MKDSNGGKNRAIIVVHGWGGSFSDAIAGVRRLLRFPADFDGRCYYLNRHDGMIVRRLLREIEEGPCVNALRKLAVSRLLASSLQPAEIEHETATTLTESWIQQTYPAFGLPLSPQARQRRATQLEVEALNELSTFMPVLNEAERRLCHEDGTLLTEQEARKALTALAGEQADGAELVALLETIRTLGETGGDLDTVASAVFYTWRLLQEAREAGEELVYGRDYLYAFVNYHEGLRNLAVYAPGTVYLADMPIGALPDLPGDLDYLARHRVRVRCYEDHHPFTRAQLAMLRQLRDSGRLDYFAMSGPLDGEELAPKDFRCGADMVFASSKFEQKEKDASSVLTPHELAMLAELRIAAHAEDFVEERNDFGRCLTDLIKGGVCKIELVQQLVKTPSWRDFREVAGQRGWLQLVEQWNAAFAEMETLLWENVVELTLQRPAEGSAPEQGGMAMGVGSDMPLAPKAAPRDTVSCLIVRACRRRPGDPRISVGRVAEYFSRQPIRADYLFYCYGADLMVCRRLNQADFSLNLGALMPQLGGPGDGGHAGAAVCRPSRNAAYPRRLLGNASPMDFFRFASYLSTRLKLVGFEPLHLADLTRSDIRREFRRGGQRLLWIAAAAFLLGLATLLFSAHFRPAAVRLSNRTFFPQIAIEPPSAAATAGAAGATTGGDAP